MESILQALRGWKNPRLFFRGVNSRRRRLRCDGRNIDVLSRLGVTQLLARLFFNGFLVALQPLNLLGIAIILLLHLNNLLAQRVVLGTFLLIDNHSIGAKHYVDKQRRSEHEHGHGRDAAPQRIDSSCQWPKALNQHNCERSRLRRVINYGPESVFRSWKARDFGPGHIGSSHRQSIIRKCLYSKIQCFAAALKASKPSRLRASV